MNIPDKISVADFNKMKRQGILNTDGKRMRSCNLLPEYEAMIEKDKLKQPAKGKLPYGYNYYYCPGCNDTMSRECTSKKLFSFCETAGKKVIMTRVDDDKPVKEKRAKPKHPERDLQILCVKYEFIIGIDPGTITGFAVWDPDKKRLAAVTSYPIHKAMAQILIYKQNDIPIYVRAEDARLRTWFGKVEKKFINGKWYYSDVDKLQGIGSIKRDCKIWFDFFTDNEIPFEMVKPVAGATKWNAETFRERTGWVGTTNEHGRDAALLCINFK